jgi:hypothetical protein
VRISLKVINSELERLGARAVLAKGDGYFYFLGGEAADWLDRTVRVPTLSSLTLEQWIERYRELKDKNRELLRGDMSSRSGDRPPEAANQPKAPQSKKRTRR